MAKKNKDLLITEESGAVLEPSKNEATPTKQEDISEPETAENPNLEEIPVQETSETFPLEDSPTPVEENDQPLPDTENVPTIPQFEAEEPAALEESAVVEDSATSEKTTAPAKPPAKRKAAKPANDDKPLSARQAFYKTDFRELDRDLSPEQEQEWNSIYASFRSGSILTGTVIGVDEYTLNIAEGDGEPQRRTVKSLVIIGYRVKVIIPETEVWSAGEERPTHVTRSLVGAKIDYVIMNVDRAGDCAIASRKMALTKRRRHVLATQDRLVGTLVKCEVLLVGAKRLLANYGGFDIPMTQKHLSYTAIADLRNEYKPGQELTARLTAFTDSKPELSVKEVNPNPFDGAELRHPIGSRRQAVIEGKYAGGIFCCLPDDTTCLCLYSSEHFDAEFDEGDTVLVHITRYDYHKKLIYGRIVSKR